MRAWLWGSGFLVAMVAGWACGDTGSENDDGDCPVGALNCPCTAGGACDPPLLCITDVCTNAGIDDDSDSLSTTAGTSMGTGGSTTNTTNDPTTSATTMVTGADSTSTSSGSSEDDNGAPKLDVGPGDDINIPPSMGCQAIDMLFVIDGSLSMAEERAALAATGSFTQVINTLESLNGGGINYRIGVTDDDDHGFLVPPGWAGGSPWFDSMDWTAMEIANHFNGAVGQVGGLGGAATGCEHVLSSGTNLIATDVSGFVRPEALLVLVLLTDVDDYGAYDQPGGNSCGVGCGTPAPPLADLINTLVTAKDGAMEGVAGIVVAGDPNVAGGSNFCNQPGSCGCVEVFPGLFDCDIFHATRLWSFADMLGDNGSATDLCAGANSVPTAVETALTVSIDLACQNFEPAG